LVHSRGINVDPAKVTAIETIKLLATIKELKSFPGKVSYIKRFIPSIASITSAFTKLLKRDRALNAVAHNKKPFRGFNRS